MGPIRQESGDRLTSPIAFSRRSLGKGVLAGLVSGGAIFNTDRVHAAPDSTLVPISTEGMPIKEIPGEPTPRGWDVLVSMQDFIDFAGKTDYALLQLYNSDLGVNSSIDTRNGEISSLTNSQVVEINGTQHIRMRNYPSQAPLVLNFTAVKDNMPIAGVSRMVKFEFASYDPQAPEDRNRVYSQRVTTDTDKLRAVHDIQKNLDPFHASPRVFFRSPDPEGEKVIETNYPEIATGGLVGVDLSTDVLDDSAYAKIARHILLRSIPINVTENGGAYSREARRATNNLENIIERLATVVNHSDELLRTGRRVPTSPNMPTYISLFDQLSYERAPDQDSVEVRTQELLKDPIEMFSSGIELIADPQLRAKFLERYKTQDADNKMVTQLSVATIFDVVWFINTNNNALEQSFPGLTEVNAALNE